MKTMKKPVFRIIGDSPALKHAGRQLLSWGYEVSDCGSFWILPVPTPAPCPEPDKDATIFGGNLPALPCRAVDLLLDEYYLLENAHITADCAISLIREKTVIENSHILILGWGRIGKSLAEKLRALGAHITVAARRPESRLEAMAQGFCAASLPCRDAGGYAVIVNTAPAPVMEGAEAFQSTYLLDLASKRGITGEGVHWARGLPGKMAPEQSGLLIAKTVLRYALGKE